MNMIPNCRIMRAHELMPRKTTNIDGAAILNNRMSSSTRRKIKIIKFNVQICRICLKQNTKLNKDLGLPLSDKDDNCKEDPLIFEALEEVVGEKIWKLKGCYSGICATCLGLLRIAYELKKQYHKSKSKIMTTLNDVQKNSFYDSQTFLSYDNSVYRSTSNIRISRKIHFKTAGVQTTETDLEKMNIEARKTSSVELIKGNATYDIKDLVIVEDLPVENKEVYRGFINNLGSVISGSFVDKRAVEGKEITEIKMVKPDVEIKPLIKENDSDNNVEVLSTEMTLETTQTSDIMKCSHCRRSFPSASYVETHMPICKQFRKLECYICKETKATRKRLILHIINKHSIGKSLIALAEEREPAICQTCHKICTSKDGLRAHMLRHREDRQYPCDQCGKTFASPYYTKTHILHVHTRKTLEVCPVCAKTFHYAGGLTTHMRIHRQDYKKEAVEVCPFCAKTFHYSGALSYHIKTHTKNYDVKCSYCNKKFGSASAKKRHERLHTGEKPYPCRFCFRAFRQVDQRLSHERACHTGERPHKCKICVASFVKKEKLKNHMFRHEGPIKCNVCRRGFVDEETVKYHLKVKHNITDEDKQDEVMQEDAENEAESMINYDTDEDQIL